jgi:hypothetical protein
MYMVTCEQKDCLRRYKTESVALSQHAVSEESKVKEVQNDTKGFARLRYLGFAALCHH